MNTFSPSSNIPSGVITTIIRLQSLLAFKVDSMDPTWDYVPSVIWTDLELGCGFVCVSLPSIRLLLMMILPKNLFSTLTGRTSRFRKSPDGDMLAHPPPQRRRPMPASGKGFSWLHLTTTRTDPIPVDTQSQGSICIGYMKSADRPPTIGSRYVMDDLETDTIGDIISVAEPKKTVAAQDKRRRQQEREWCTSCGSQNEYITALPVLGILPDRSYSETELVKKK